MDLTKAMDVSASGMYAQGERVRVIAENVANADSTAQTPGGSPYERKLITFKSLVDRMDFLGRKVTVHSRWKLS